MSHALHLVPLEDLVCDILYWPQLTNRVLGYSVLSFIDSLGEGQKLGLVLGSWCSFWHWYPLLHNALHLVLIANYYAHYDELQQLTPDDRTSDPQSLPSWWCSS